MMKVEICKLSGKFYRESNHGFDRNLDSYLSLTSIISKQYYVKAIATSFVKKKKCKVITLFVHWRIICAYTHTSTVTTIWNVLAGGFLLLKSCVILSFDDIYFIVKLRNWLIIIIIHRLWHTINSTLSHSFLFSLFSSPILLSLSRTLSVTFSLLISINKRQFRIKAKWRCYYFMGIFLSSSFFDYIYYIYI